MKYNFTNLFQKSILLFALFLISFMFAQNPDLEMTTGGGSTSNGPSTSINVNFSKNSDNPTGSTYNTYTVASGLSVTFSLQNFTAAYQGTTISGGNSVSFGHTGSTVGPQYGQFTTGAPTNVLFTSSTSTAGTGIIVNGTAATNNYGVVVKAYTSKLNPTVPRNGRVKQAELKIVFSRPVNNPILQITGLGGASGSNGFSSEFTVNTGLSDAISGITRLSGTTAFAVSGLNVTNNAVPMTASGAGVGSGSVRIDGTNITTIVLDVYMHGDGTGNLNSWGNGTNADTSGDAFVIGFTATESDLEITKTVSPTAALVGDNVVFNLTAKNNGASNNTNVSVNDLLPTGYTYDSHIASTGAASYVPGTGVWTVGNLNDGASATLAITAKVKSTGNYTNTATISTTSGISDPLSSNNSANAAVSILLDTDGDGVDDFTDLDDDNDGILDSVECPGFYASEGGLNAPITTVTAGKKYTQALGNTIITFSTTSGTITSFSESTSNSADLYAVGTPIRYVYPSIGTTQRMDFSSPIKTVFGVCDIDQPGESDVIRVYDAAGNLIANPGSYLKSSYIGTSGTYPNGVSTNFNDIGSNSGLNITQGATTLTVSRASGNAQPTFNRPNMLIFDFSQLEVSRIEVTNNGTSGSPAFFFDKINNCTQDTDGDGIKDYLDTDSDNDGCPDATEGAAHLATTATLTGGSNGGSSANLGTTVNANGIPTSAATSATTGQATTTGVTSAVRVNAGTTPPATQTANTGTTVTLTSNATADAATTWATTTPFAPNYTTPGNATSGLTYSWTKDGTAVSNGGGISGATTAALTLTGVTAASAGTYVVTVRHPNNYCGTFTQTILTINAACYDLPNNGAGELPTNHGITTLQRAGSEVSNGNWPMVRTGAWTVLESKTKGFVITRMTTLEIEGQTTPTVILSQITNPQEGMMVYDKTAKCLKIYSDSAWKCFETPACP